MPQVGSQGLVDDATAAYMFARKWNLKDGVEREVIVGGASAGMHPRSIISRISEQSQVFSLLHK